MLFLKYFGVVGATLLSLLFAADAYLPEPLERDNPARSYNIRIASERKAPEAVTFSGHATRHPLAAEHAPRVAEAGSQPLVGVPQPPVAAATTPASASVARTDAAPARRKVAKRRPPPPTGFAANSVWRESYASSRHRFYGW